MDCTTSGERGTREQLTETRQVESSCTVVPSWAGWTGERRGSAAARCRGARAGDGFRAKEEKAKELQQRELGGDKMRKKEVSSFSVPHTPQPSPGAFLKPKPKQLGLSGEMVGNTSISFNSLFLVCFFVCF